MLLTKGNAAKTEYPHLHDHIHLKEPGAVNNIKQDNAVHRLPSV